jgi:hypothetical protein
MLYDSDYIFYKHLGYIRTYIYTYVYIYIRMYICTYVKMYIKTNNYFNYYSIYVLCMVAPTCFGNILPSSGNVPRAF